MGKSRLVILSNRLPNLPGEAVSTDALKKMPVGGLVSALISALERTGGGVWAGWSGRSLKPEASCRFSQQLIGNILFLPIDLADAEVNSYYNGFCNRTIWPLCHLFQARVKINLREEEVYRRVNGGFATVLRKFLEPGDLVWVHDYHLFHAGRDLRQQGWAGPLGFFLHIPFPPPEFWSILPNAKGYLEDMTAYDLIGFHTQMYMENYVRSQQRLNGASWNGRELRRGDECQRVGVFPIGADPERFKPTADRKKRRHFRKELRAEGAERKLILGVDRLDYTKGLPERVLAFENLCQRYPDVRGRASLIQICSPSRARVPEYLEQKRELDLLVGRVNGELATHDWTPIRYLYRSYSQDQLAHFYREADIGLVTPLRDGMNLVAKEFVAAQPPENPGVLVLSRFTGAAEELTEAILVNPYVIEDVADGLMRALQMPLAERRDRYRAMYQKVCQNTAVNWAQNFLAALVERTQPPATGGGTATDESSRWPREMPEA